MVIGWWECSAAKATCGCECLSPGEVTVIVQCGSWFHSLKPGSWDRVSGGWMPMVRPLVDASGSRVTLLEALVFVDSNQPLLILY